jgi:hypothetical protein
MRGYFATHMYGLEPRDMTYCRILISKVVELASKHGTADQQERAKLLMRTFEWYDAAAEACGAAIFSPDGKLADKDAAVELLKNIPQAAQSFEKWKRIPPETNGWFAHDWITRHTPPNIVAYTVPAAGRFMDHQEVSDELRALALNIQCPSHIRCVASCMLKTFSGFMSGGMLANGSFEKDGDHGWRVEQANGKISRSDRRASYGTHALRCESGDGNLRASMIVEGANPDDAYFASARVFIPEEHDSPGARTTFWGSPTYIEGKRPELKLEPGKWHYLCTLIPGTDRGDKITLYVEFSNFKKGAVVYMDDVQLYKCQ